MRRLVLEKVKLSDGTVIPKNSILAVSARGMWNKEVHEKPEEWDGYRFYNMRSEPSKEHVAQLVSTSPEHMAFGYGQQACPGRFFAANELKVVLIHLLMKYDWKIPEGTVSGSRVFGLGIFADPAFKMDVRRRQEEIEIDLQ